MQRLIEKRAAASGQHVDALAVVEALTQEGVLDDRRYAANRISFLTDGINSSGPKEIKRRLETLAGLPETLVDEFLDPNDAKWFQQAERIRDKTLSSKRVAPGPNGEVPQKVFHSLKQALQRKGFTGEQIRHALQGLNPVREKKVPITGDLPKQIAKLKQTGKGPVAILHLLKQKGYEETLIRRQLESEEDWIDLARLHLNQHFKGSSMRTMKERKQRIDFLMRRGFTSDQIRKALNDP